MPKNTKPSTKSAPVTSSNEGGNPSSKSGPAGGGKSSKGGKK